MGRLRLLQQRQKDPGEPHNCAKVDAHQPVKVVCRHLLKLAAQGDAGIVDQHRGPAVVCLHMVQQSLGRFGLAHVQHLGTDLDPKSLSLGSHNGQTSTIHIGQRQVAAFFSQLQSQSGTNTPSRPGDHGHPISQIQFAHGCHRRSSFGGS